MKKIIISFLVLIVALVVAYKYLYHEHRDIANEKSVFTTTVKVLLNDFLTDETKANAKYLDKSITVTGRITNVDLPNKTIVLDEKVFVILNTTTQVKLNSEVVIQGRLIGFDSLLEEIKIDQAELK